MARDKTEIGILIKAKDTAAAVLAGVGKAATGMSRAVQSMARSAGNALKGLGMGVIALNQGFGLAKKVFKGFDMVVGDTVRKALEFRKANDASSKAINDLQKNVELTRARLGDALIPVLKGVADAMNPILKSAQAWLAANQKLIAGKILEWGMKLGTVLIKGVAAGAIAVAKAWNGWLMIVDLVKGGIEKFFGFVVSGTGSLIQVLGDAAAALGMNSVNEKLQSVGQTIKDLGNEFSMSGDASFAAVEKTSAALEEQERIIKNLETNALAGLEKVGVKVQQSINTATVGTNTSLEQQAKFAEELAKKKEFWAKRDEANAKLLDEVHQANAERRVELSNKIAEAEEENARQTHAVITELVGGAMNALLDTFDALIQGTQSFQQAMGSLFKTVAKMVIQAALSFVIAKAVEGAASAWAAAIEEYNVYGVIIGAGLAAAAFAGIYALSSQLKGFSKGGEATGGIPGKDSVPAMLTPGERVLTVEQTRLFNKMVGKPTNSQPSTAGVQSFARGGEVQRSTGGLGVTVNIAPALQTVAPPSEAETKRFMLKNLKPALEQLIRDGQIRLA